MCENIDIMCKKGAALSDSSLQCYKKTYFNENVFYSLSEQSRDHAVFIDVDALGRRGLWKPGHRHDRACERNDKACAGGDPEVAHRYGKAGGCAELCRIV